MVEFCDRCGTRLRPKRIREGDRYTLALVCNRCGAYRVVSETPVVTESPEEAQPSIKVVGEEESQLQTMPTTQVECPKCGNDTAYWWMVQTRSGDEGTTQFYRCTKCSYTWRLYT
jgi:DNA-directed RNA polymerase subunit M